MTHSGFASLLESCQERSGRTIRADILGPPAVGKSTIIRAVLQSQENVPRHGRGHIKWVGIDSAAMIAYRCASASQETPPSVANLPSRLTRLIKSYVKRVVHRNYGVLVENRRFAASKATLIEQFLNEHHILFETIVENWYEPEIVLPPLSIRYADLLRWTAEWLFVMRWAGGVPILADNARLTRGVAELLSSSRYGNSDHITGAAYRFMVSQVGPSAVIHVTAAPTVIAERACQRLSERGFEHLGHRGRSQEDIVRYSTRRNEVNRNAVGYFREWGIPVLTIDAVAEISESARQVQAFLDGILNT